MTCELLRALRRANIISEHVDTSDPRPHDTIGQLDRRNVRLAIEHAWRLHSSLRRYPRADVYAPISQGTMGFLRDAVFVALARAHRRRVYLHLHGADFRTFYLSSNRLMRFVIRFTLSNAHQLWLLSPSLSWMTEGLIPAGRVRHVENVVPDHFRGETRTPVCHTDNRPLRLLYIGNMRPGKNCFDLISALRRLAPWRRSMCTLPVLWREASGSA